MNRCTLRIRRQDAPNDPASRRYETFSVDITPRTTVADALRAIGRRPVTTGGNEVPPVAWERGCLEGSCGACTVLVDGVASVACTTRFHTLRVRRNIVTIEPLRAFPVVRDLVVDRSRATADLAAAHVWVDAPTGGEKREPAPKMAPSELGLERCTSCAACLEACPEYGEKSPFWGAAVLLESERLRERLSPEMREARVVTLLGKGGIAGCGQSGNCEEVCPEGIPLVEMLATAARAATVHVFDSRRGKIR
jgi:succinate dehydrogenase / fumarate reductase iron-sulfur subunit